MEAKPRGSLLFGSEQLPAMLLVLLGNPRRRWRWKELHEALAGVNPDSLYRALDRAIELGVVRREAKGRYGTYVANTASPLYRDVRRLLGKLDLRPSSRTAYRAESLARIADRLHAQLQDEKIDPESASWIYQFVDDFRASRRRDKAELLEAEPAPTGSQQVDAYVAALAEHLAEEAGIRAPRWTEEPKRFLKRWWFQADVPSERPAAIVQSPPAFRRRGIFIPGRALQRI